MYIAKQQDFEDFLSEVSEYDVLALDTEFIRDNTYWPKLCLLQMAVKDKVVCVDPFEVDISVMSEVFLNKNIVKVFHAPRQDIEILRHKTGAFPEPIFDTQTAASFLGHTIQIGYANLVSSELKVELNKGNSYSDWSKRPLSRPQIKYAQNDVTYLLKLYDTMTDKLKKLNRLDWVLQDTQKFLNPSLYDIDPYDRYIHLSRVSSLKSSRLAIAKEVAAWREKAAMKRNLPRRWVMSDDLIIEVSKQNDLDLNTFFSLRGTKGKICTSDAREILAAYNKGKSYNKEDYPDLISKKGSAFGNNPSEGGLDSIMDLMCAIVRLRARQNDLAPQVITTNQDLKEIAKGCTSCLSVLEGWRKDIVGNELLDLMSGKIRLSVKDGQLNVKK